MERLIVRKQTNISDGFKIKLFTLTNLQIYLTIIIVLNISPAMPGPHF